MLRHVKTILLILWKIPLFFTFKKMIDITLMFVITRKFRKMFFNPFIFLSSNCVTNYLLMWKHKRKAEKLNHCHRPKITLNSVEKVNLNENRDNEECLCEDSQNKFTIVYIWRQSFNEWFNSSAFRQFAIWFYSFVYKLFCIDSKWLRLTNDNYRKKSNNSI